MTPISAMVTCRLYPCLTFYCLFQFHRLWGAVQGETRILLVRSERPYGLWDSAEDALRKRARTLRFVTIQSHSIAPSSYEHTDDFFSTCTLSGIKRLMKQAVFAAAYPLHEGAHTSKNQGVNKIENKRQELYYEWARPGAFMKEQPYDAIRSVHSANHILGMCRGSVWHN